MKSCFKHNPSLTHSKYDDTSRFKDSETDAKVLIASRTNLGTTQSVLVKHKNQLNWVSQAHFTKE